MVTFRGDNSHNRLHTMTQNNGFPVKLTAVSLKVFAALVCFIFTILIPCVSANNQYQCQPSSDPCKSTSGCVPDKKDGFCCEYKTCINKTGNNNTRKCEQLTILETERETHSVTFKWKSVKDDAYKIRHCGGTNYTANSSGGKADEPQPGTKYSFVVEIESSNGAVAEYHVTVWTKGELDRYVIRINNETHSGSGTTYLFRNLTSGLYNYSITAYNSHNDSAMCSGTLRIEAITPGEVQDLTIHSNESKVSWAVPLYPNGDIIGYHLFVKSLDRDVNYTHTYIITYPDCHFLCIQNDTTSCQNSSEELNSNTTIFSENITDLQPDTNYTIEVKAVNKAGFGQPANKRFRTPEAAANNVTNITLSSVHNSSTKSVILSVTWIPGAHTGNTSYSIMLQEEIPEGSNEFERCYDSPEIVTETAYVHNDVKANWNYRASVQACTRVGCSANVSSSSHKTEENYPGPVENLTVVQDDNIASKIIISFDWPKRSNGTIKHFIIRKADQDDSVAPCNHCVNSCNSTYSTEDVGRVSRGNNYPLPVELCNRGKCIYSNVNVGEIIVGKNYTFAVFAKNKFEGRMSCEKQLEVMPRRPQLHKYTSIIKITNSSKESKDYEVDIELCDECIKNQSQSQGNLTYAGLLVCVINPCKNYTESFKYNEIKTWADSRSPDFKESYHATPMGWEKTLTSKFTIGNDASCPKNAKDDYCNGPLPSGKIFYIAVVICNEAGCATVSSGVLKTKADYRADNTTTVVVVVIILLLILVACIATLVLWRRGTLRRTFGLKKMTKLPPICEKRPVKIREFEEHVRKLHKDSNLLFQDEFQDLGKLCLTLQTACNEAQREQNRVKNRYVDILPYDHSRVRLDIEPEGDETMDFINANYIPGFNSVREYIATQGPMHCTVQDFWRMVWEQKSTVIVMLSDLQENARRKVDLYWPEELNEPVIYENVVVELTSFSQQDKYFIRNFKISKGGETRKVIHFFLSGWWDFSANLTNDEVLEFIKLVRKEITPDSSGPIIVHCSAGVGRTGTMIALDYFVQYIDTHSLDDEIDIFDYVLRMRRSRPRMVQTEGQYIFIFDALQEVIQRKLKAEEPQNLTASNSKSAETDQHNETPQVSVQVENSSCVYQNEAFEAETSKTDDSSEQANIQEKKPTTDL